MAVKIQPSAWRNCLKAYEWWCSQTFLLHSQESNLKAPTCGSHVDPLKGKKKVAASYGLIMGRPIRNPTSAHKMPDFRWYKENQFTLRAVTNFQWAQLQANKKVFSYSLLFGFNCTTFNFLTFISFTLHWMVSNIHKQI